MLGDFHLLSTRASANAHGQAEDRHQVLKGSGLTLILLDNRIFFGSTTVSVELK